MDFMPIPAFPSPGEHMGQMMPLRPLAMAYVTPQHRITRIYASDEALRMGTLFPELYKPFMGRRIAG